MNKKSSHNQSWNLKSFLDSFILELDKAQETLAIKGLNQPLTYSVKDVSLDLPLFPEFDGKQVRFSNAKPGEEGAAKLSLQFGSITDRQIRQTTKQPITKDDLHLEEVEDLDEETKDSLRKIGVSSVRDWEKLEERKIDIAQAPVFKEKPPDIKSLADKLKKLRNRKQRFSIHQSRMEGRQKLPPVIHKLKVQKQGKNALIQIKGENLSLTQSFKPVAMVNDQMVVVLKQDAHEVTLQLDPQILRPGVNHFKIATDPYSVLNFTSR